MKLGDVLYFSDYEFANGGHADKLFIVFQTPKKKLSSCSLLRQKERILATLVVSQRRGVFLSVRESMDSSRILGLTYNGMSML